VPSEDTLPNLYERWLNALGEQWADEVLYPLTKTNELWKAKRLQTGLASWTTLRHATVLVNDLAAAECGEGAFEPIVTEAPRGYVEPDPASFQAIAELFDAARRFVEATFRGASGKIPAWEGEAREPLRQGIERRLTETAAKARLFAAIAKKQIRGEPLTPKEYEEILYIGRIAEHHFLIYRSLASQTLALSIPPPMPKTVEIGDGTQLAAGYRVVAVGRPLEWDQIVPHFGRKQIVKGVAYSFYEFNSPRILNDDEWLKQLSTQAQPEWIAPFVSPSRLQCPTRDPF
jgi:hypothetical protein